MSVLCLYYRCMSVGRIYAITIVSPSDLVQKSKERPIARWSFARPVSVEMNPPCRNVRYFDSSSSLDSFVRLSHRPVRRKRALIFAHAFPADLILASLVREARNDILIRCAHEIVSRSKPRPGPVNLDNGTRPDDARNSRPR